MKNEAPQAMKRQSKIISCKKLFIEYGIYFAYYAPDGEIQTRSIAKTKKLSKELIAFREYGETGLKVTHKDYEAKGFTLHKIHLHIHPSI